MSRVPPTPDRFSDLAFPLAGLDNSGAYGDQRPGTGADGMNVRGFEPSTLRARGGSRPGLEKYIPALVGGPNVIQHLNYVVDPDGSALLANYEWPPGTLLEDDPSNNPGGFDPRNQGQQVPLGPPNGTGITPSKSSKRTPRIVWPTPADITQGSPLDGSVLDAAAFDPRTGNPVAGNFNYNPASGTVLDAGQHQPLNTTFQPTDTRTYRQAQKTVFINVTTPAITFRQAQSALFTTGDTISVVLANTVKKKDALLFAALTQSNTTGGGGNNDEVTVAVTDTQGNTYTQVGGYRRFGFIGLTPGVVDAYYGLSLWRASAGMDGAVAVDCVADGLAGPDSFQGASLASYRGVKTATSPLDNVNGRAVGNPPGLTWTTGNVAVSVAGDLVVAVFGSMGGGYTSFVPDPSFEERTAAPFALDFLDRLAPPVGNQVGSAVVTLNPFAPAGYLSIGASFKKA